MSSRVCTSPRRCPTPSRCGPGRCASSYPRDAVVTDWTACWFYTGVLPAGQHVEVPPLSVFRPAGHDRLRNTLCASGERGFVGRRPDPRRGCADHDAAPHGVGPGQVVAPRPGHRRAGRAAAARFVHARRAGRRGRTLQGHARRHPAARAGAAGRCPVGVPRRVDAAAQVAGPHQPAAAHAAGPDHGRGHRGVPRGPRRPRAPLRVRVRRGGVPRGAARAARRCADARTCATGSPGTWTRSASRTCPGRRGTSSECCTTGSVALAGRSAGRRTSGEGGARVAGSARRRAARVAGSAASPPPESPGQRPAAPPESPGQRRPRREAR